MKTDMKAPYPYFGGKSRIMPQVWQRLGDPYNLVDSFFGSNAPTISRPAWDWETGQWRDGRNRIETVNDEECFLANFWRAITADPEQVAYYTDWPVNEADLSARHLWLVNNNEFVEAMKTDPDYYDPKVAGWWVWGICQWIGGEWCKLGKEKPSQRRPELKIGGFSGGALNYPSRRRPELKHSKGVQSLAIQPDLYEYFDKLSLRFRRVRVCCGDWTRVLGPTPTYKNGLTGIILDPPYGKRAKRSPNIYNHDSLDIADKVREWAIENGNNQLLRIALFGYEDEHSQAMPDDWECLAWKTNGGMASQNSDGNLNREKERVWFSPHCLKVEEIPRQLEFL